MFLQDTGSQTDAQRKSKGKDKNTQTNRQTKKNTKTQTEKHKHIEIQTQTETQENDKEEDGKDDMKRKSEEEVNQHKRYPQSNLFYLVGGKGRAEHSLCRGSDTGQPSCSDKNTPDLRIICSIERFAGQVPCS